MKTTMKLTLMIALIWVAHLGQAQNGVQLKQVWKKHIRGETGDEIVNGLSVQPNGSVLIAGRYLTSTFGALVDVNHPSTSTLPLTNSFSDGYVISYGPQGNVNWASRYNYNNNDAIQDVAVNSLGVPYVVGGGNTSSNSTDFAFSNLYIGQANSTTGALTNNISSNGTLTNRFNSIAMDQQGNSYCGGIYSGNPDVNLLRGTAVLPGLASGSQDALIVKHTPSRNAIWVRRIGGTGYDEISRVVIHGNHIYVAGVFTGRVDFNPSTAAADTFFLQTPSTNRNGFILKLDTAGNFVSVWSISSTTETCISDIVVHSTNEIYACGYFFGTADANPGAGTNTVISAGSADGLLIKLDAAGNLLWSRQYGGTNDDRYARIALNREGDIYGCGYFNSVSVNFGFPTSLVLSNASGSNTSDGFIVAYTNGGNSILANRIGGTSNDFVSAIAFDTTNSLYATMHFGSAIETEFYPGLSSITTPAAGFDAVLVKYNTICPFFVFGGTSLFTCSGISVQIPTLTTGTNLSKQWRFNGNLISNNSVYSGVNADTLVISNISSSDTGIYTLEVSRSGCPTIQTQPLTIATTSGSLTISPVQHYPLNGNFNSTTGSTLPVITDPLQALFQSNRFGGAGRALRFTSTNNSINIPNVTSARQSYAFWFQPVSGGATHATLLWDGGTAANRILSLNNNQLGTLVNNVFTGFGITLSNNVWHHIVYIKDSSRCMVYINGVLRYDNPTLLPSGSITVSEIFGQSGWGVTPFGFYDDAYVFNTAIAQREVTILFNQIEAQNTPRSVQACESTNISIPAFFSTDSTLTFQWYRNGTALVNDAIFNGVNNDTLRIINGTGVQNGQYYCLGRKDCYEARTDSISVFFGTPNLNSGLLSYYSFNGNVNDEISNRNMSSGAIYNGTSRFGVTGVINASLMGSALTFTPVANDSISIAVWINPTGSTGRVILAAVNSNAAHLMLDNNNNIGYRLANGTFVSSNVRITNNTWSHLAVTKTATNHKIYLNGELIMSTSNSFLNSIANNALGRIVFSSLGESAQSLYDDMYIYTREINPTEVVAIMNRFRTSRNPGLARACNGSNNTVLLSAAFENTDTTKYTMQWLFNGSPISNNAKYQGANSDTLQVSNVNASDSGLYQLRITPTALTCTNWLTQPGRIQIDLPSLMQDSLRLYLKLNNNVRDHSGRNIPVNNVSTTFANDRYTNATGAANFDGSASYLHSTAVIPANTNVLTVMAWFKTNQGTGGIIGNSNALPPNTPTSTHALIYIGNDNKLHGKAWNGNSSAITSAADVNDNQWHHAALVIEGNNSVQRLYLDGVLIGTLPTTTNTLNTTFTAGIIHGNTTNWFSTNSGWNYFQGQIDDIRIYNRPFAQEEIARIAQNIGFVENGTTNSGYCNATTVSLTANPVGTGLTRLWHKNGVPLTNTGNISGTDSNTLRFNSVSIADTGVYQLYVSKDCYALLSDSFIVRVFNGITIQNAPTNQARCFGDTVRISVRATGAGLTYQWLMGNMPLSNNSKYAGTTSDTLIIRGLTQAEFGTYRVRISDFCGNADSNGVSVVSLTTQSPPAIPTPLAIYAMNGNANANITIHNGTATATTPANNRYQTPNTALSFVSSNSSRVVLPAGMSTSGKANYSVSLWFKTSTTNTAMGLFGCANSLPPASVPTSYNPMLYINSSGNLTGKMFNGNATVLVTSPNKVDDSQWHHAVLSYSQPGNIQFLYLDGVLLGQITGSFTLPSGLIPTIGATYGQGWSGHSPGWSFFNGEMDDVRIYSNTLTTPEVREIFIRSELNSTRTIQVCPGQTTVGFRSGTFGSFAAYQWRKNGLPIQNGAKYAGTQTDSLTILNYTIADSGSYTCEIWYGCLSFITNPVQVTNGSIPVITAHPNSVSSCTGGSVALSVSASGLGLSYQWRKNGVPLSNGANISGATTATLTLSSLTVSDTAGYSCVVSNTCGFSTSFNAHVSLGASLQILQQPANVSACAGGTAQLIVQTNDPNATYLWRKNGVDIPGSNNDTLFLTGLTSNDAANYSVQITSVCGSATSNNALLTVNPLISLISQSTSRTACAGNTVTLFVIATGSNISYQWRKDGVDIAGANSASYSITNYSSIDAGNYVCVVSGDCNTLNSATITLSTSTPLTITSQPASYNNLCVNVPSNITFSVSATGSVQGYQWFHNATQLSNMPGISGANTAMLTVNHAVFGSGNYTCRIIGGCDTLTSNAGVVSYLSNPEIVSAPISRNVCSGENVSFKVRANHTIGYTWYINGIQVNNLPGKVTGAGTDSLTLLAVTQADIGGISASIEVMLSGSCPNSNIMTNSALLSVQNALQITTQSASTQSACTGSSITLYVNANTDASYIWKKNGVVIAGAIDDTLQLNSVGSADTGTYTCDITSACGNITSQPMSLSVNQAPQPTVSQNGNTLTTQVFDTYQWLKDGSTITGATQQTLTATTSGLYAVQVSQNGCTAQSADFNFIFSGLGEFYNSNTVRYYPNPFTSEVTIRLSDYTEALVKITSMEGKCVREVLMHNREMQLDLSELASGVYLISVEHQGLLIITDKLIKQ